MDEVLPADSEILGSCMAHGPCDLYFREKGTAIYNETRAYDECRDIGDDVGWDEDWWAAGEPCPTSIEYECRTGCPTSFLESACRYVNRVEFQYSQGDSTTERRTSCDLNGGTFFEF